jgi:hypothetical protein
MPRRWYAEGTNKRGMPIGVERGSGLQNKLELGSTETRRAVGGSMGSAFEVVSATGPRTSAEEAMAIAVEMWVAMTQPAIVSQESGFSDGRRKR